MPQLVQAGIEDVSTETGTIKSLDCGDRLYESMHDHALSGGPLEFPMMGWPHWVANTNNGLQFNTLTIPAPTTKYSVSDLANCSFVGLDYPDIAYNHKAQIMLLAGKAKAAATNAAAHTFRDLSALSNSVPSFMKRQAETQSSHCAAIHVPPLPLIDGTIMDMAVQCDLVIDGTFEVDCTLIKDYADQNHWGSLGEVWDDTIDPTFSPWKGMSLMDYSKSRVQWLCGMSQYVEKSKLKAKGGGTNDQPIIDAIFGTKFQTSMDPVALNA